jgi:hypothetical protein
MRVRKDLPNFLLLFEPIQHYLAKDPKDVTPQEHREAKTAYNTFMAIIYGPGKNKKMLSPICTAGPIKFLPFA